MLNYIRRIARFILNSTIRKRKFEKRIKKEFYSIRRKKQNAIVFVGTPIHGNLGDQAIVYAEKKFFEEQGLLKRIVEIDTFEYDRYQKALEKLVSKDDIIIIDGGGSLGTLWINEEYKIRNIIKTFNENPIFIFPQTIFYSNDTFGKEELQKSIEVFSQHKKLYIAARELQSYSFLAENYRSNTILYMPDIVLFLSKLVKVNEKNGILTCFRKDKEKVLDDELIAQIENKIKATGRKIIDGSTVIDKIVTSKNREKELFNKWKTYASSELVVTDRLHGMIFAAIVGTPCIAFNNSSNKVGNVYEWIKHVKSIHFVSEEDSKNSEVYLDKIVEFLDTKRNIDIYDSKHLKDSYTELAEKIKSYVK